MVWKVAGSITSVDTIRAGAVARAAHRPGHVCSLPPPSVCSLVCFTDWV